MDVPDDKNLPQVPNRDKVSLQYFFPLAGNSKDFKFVSTYRFYVWNLNYYTQKNKNLVRTVLVCDFIYLKYFNLNWISTNFFNMFLVISIFSSLCLLVI